MSGKMIDKAGAKLGQGANLATDNLVGGAGGAVLDAVQSGNEYALMRSGMSSWSTSEASSGLGRLGQLGKAGDQVADYAKIGGVGLSALGLLGGYFQTDQGIAELQDGNLEDGLLNTGAGAGSLVSGGVGLAGALGNATAIGGTGAAGLGTAVAGAGAAPIAATVGGGLAAGITTGTRGNSYIADTGLLGRNHDGSGRSWSDWAGDQGAETYANAIAAGDSENWAMAKGLGMTGAASVAAVPGAAVTGVAGLATDVWDFFTD